MIGNEQIKALQQRVDVLGRCINIDAKRAEVEQKQERTLAPDFWDDPKEAEKFLKELSGVKFWVTGYDKVAAGAEDLNVLLDFARESLDGAEDEVTSEVEELENAYGDVLSELEALELRNMLGEEGDNLGAVLTINSGAGGTEANDWSAMLMRMYIRWAERNGYKVTITDELEGEDAGIKSVTMQVEGDYAFGYHGTVEYAARLFLRRHATRHHGRLRSMETRQSTACDCRKEHRNYREIICIRYLVCQRGELGNNIGVTIEKKDIKNAQCHNQ